MNRLYFLHSDKPLTPEEVAERLGIEEYVSCDDAGRKNCFYHKGEYIGSKPTALCFYLYTGDQDIHLKAEALADEFKGLD